MRIQVPACPRPPRPQAQASARPMARPQRASGGAGPTPSRASRLFALLRFDAGESRRTGIRLRKPECLISIPVTIYVPATGRTAYGKVQGYTFHAV